MRVLGEPIPLQLNEWGEQVGCRWCGVGLVQRQFGRPRKWCSDEHRTRYARWRKRPVIIRGEK